MSKQVDELKDLHYKIRSLIEAKKWEALKKILTEIKHAHDINKSKTALIITQSLIENENILEERFSLYKSFNDDLGHGFRNNMNIFKKSDPNVPTKYKT